MPLDRAVGLDLFVVLHEEAELQGSMWYVSDDTLASQIFLEALVS